MTVQNIIEFLEQVGEYSAAEKIRKHYLTKQRKIRDSHKRVLLLLFALGTDKNPLKVPLKKTKRGDQYNYKRAFWQAIEWLMDRTSNSFKARFQELKEWTNWVESPKTGVYQITWDGVIQAKKLISEEKEARLFFLTLRNKLHYQQDNRAKFLRSILAKTGNLDPLTLEQFNEILSW